MTLLNALIRYQGTYYTDLLPLQACHRVGRAWDCNLKLWLPIIPGVVLVARVVMHGCPVHQARMVQRIPQHVHGCCVRKYINVRRHAGWSALRCVLSLPQARVLALPLPLSPGRNCKRSCACTCVCGARLQAGKQAHCHWQHNCRAQPFVALAHEASVRHHWSTVIVIDASPRRPRLLEAVSAALTIIVPYTPPCPLACPWLQLHLSRQWHGSLGRSW